MVITSNIYEGSDSEDEDLIVMTETVVPEPPKISDILSDDDESSDEIPLRQKKPKTKKNPKPYKPFDLGYPLKVGELSREDERFCSFQLVKKYPYSYIGNANRQRVDDTFFNGGKVYDFAWEFFYLYRDLLENSAPPILLVTTRQFISFLARINKHFKTKLSIPDGAKGAFEVLFGINGTPRPRYLGQASSKLETDNLYHNMPSSTFKLDGEPYTPKIVTDDHREIFRRNIYLVLQNKQNKFCKKEKAKKKRLENQTTWRQTIKRVQRYLGLRQAKATPHSKRSFVQRSVEATTEKLASTVFFDANSPTIFPQENSVIFVCVDVEAYELNSMIITEIGFATLDTRDISSTPPGELGINWRSLIRPRHFRISENTCYVNSTYISGCAERFEFGSSEFISIKNARQIISDCFRCPLARPGESTIDDQSARKIIFVGHDVNSDIRFLKTLGYDVYSLPNLVELVDTALMFRVLKREMATRSLGTILIDMGIVGWSLHNAGNDAVYTLQAMIAIAIKFSQAKENPEKKITSEIGSNTVNQRPEVEEVWSSAGDSDGGLPSLDFSASNVCSNAKRINAGGSSGSRYRSQNRSQGNMTGSSSHQASIQRTSHAGAQKSEFFSVHNSPREW